MRASIVQPGRKSCRVPERCNQSRILEQRSPSLIFRVPPILAARRYVSPRLRPITAEEAETRRIAYALKRGEETKLAAKEMAVLLPTELPALTLVPVPSSTCSIDANRRLCNAIAEEYGPAARVMPAIKRIIPVESSCFRRRHGMLGLTAADHKFVRVGGWVVMPVFLVDNVATTGATLAAARQVFGFGTGLVFADASPAHLPLVRS
jgi:hypothetical protein